MKKLLLLSIAIFISFSVSAQNPGLAKGLSYKHDYQKDIDNAIQLKQLERENVRDKYKRLQELYKYQTEYKPVSDGWHLVLATDGTSLFDSREVYVSNGVVIQYKNGSGRELTITSGGKIIEGKTIIALKEDNNIVVELYFGFKLN